MRGQLREVLSVAIPFAIAFAVVVATRTESLVPARTGRDGARTEVVDAAGRRAPIRRYVRIASSSMLIDRLLLELVEPERVIGFSNHGYEGSVVAYRFGDKARIEPSDDLEALISLRPDLLLVNNFVDPGRIRRLSDAGVVVFDLGQMGGLSSLLADVRLVGDLVDEHERGEAIARSFAERMHQVAVDVPASARRRAIYVGVHGTQIFGGARGTSYHDVLEAAGLVDIAADRYEGWPSYTSEDILALAPQTIVAPRGQGFAICRLTGLADIDACRDPKGIVEIEPGMMVDPGLTMLEAAEAVRNAVHGRPVR